MSFFDEDEDELMLLGPRKKAKKTVSSTIHTSQTIQTVQLPSGEPNSTNVLNGNNHESNGGPENAPVKFLSKKQREALRLEREAQETQEVCKQVFQVFIGESEQL